MTPNFVRFIIVLIAFLAFDGYSSRVYHFSSDNYELAKTPELKIDPLQNPTSRGNYKLINYIADPFFPIVVLVHSLYSEKSVIYYLPLYELHREKKFFLLV